MNILRLSTLSLTLAIAVMTLGYVNSSSAAKKGIDCTDPSSHPSCKPSDDSSPSENLSASFCLTIDATTSSPYIVSDGKSPTVNADEYCDDSKEKVAVFTGSGTGFRWDTNLQNNNKTQLWMRWRLVHMTAFIDAKGGAIMAPYEIDFRFNLPNGGLDLGSLVAQGDEGCPDAAPGACTGNVAASLTYYAGGDVAGFDDLNYGVLGFGDIDANINDIDDDPHNAARACLSAAGEIKVTRTGEMTWELESNMSGLACRFALNGNGGAKCTNGNDCSFGKPDKIAFVFKFLLDQQE